MKEVKHYKALNEFAEFLDFLPSSKLKGEISHFFTGYVSLYHDYMYLKYRLDMIDSNYEFDTFDFEEADNKCGKT